MIFAILLSHVRDQWLARLWLFRKT